MIADRSYMREGRRFHRPSASVQLMIVLTILFALQSINAVYIRSGAVGYLALTPMALGKGWLWQLLTFQFLHGGLLHLAGNLLGLWFIGRFVEQILGVKRYLLAYFGSGIVGGLLQCGLMLLFPRHFGDFVLGASAGVTGIFAIFCRLQADSEIRWNFILPIRADVMLWILGGISLFFTIVPADRGTAHAAHLGGLLAGLAFVKFRWHQDFRPLPWMEWFAALKRRRQASPIVKVRFPKASSASCPGEPVSRTEVDDGDFISQQVDPILDKLHAHGRHSLTDRELDILKEARSRMEKR